VPEYVANSTSVDVFWVKDMAPIFTGASGNISAWNANQMTIMSCMFYQATAFNDVLSYWNVSWVNEFLTAC
jgi:hypothetical protein